MKKFLAALTLALIVASTNFVEAAEFTSEQIKQMLTITIQNPAVTQNKMLKLNAETFRKNFNAFMVNFIKNVNAGTDSAMMRQFLAIDGADVSAKGDYTILGKNFGGKVMIIGLADNGKNFKVLNFFAARIENRDDALLYRLILDAFVKSISPDFDAKTLLDRFEKNHAAPVIHNGVKYSVAKSGDVDVIAATAAP